MFERILVPLDGGAPASRALRAAEHLADRWDCELHAIALIQKSQSESGVQHIIRRQVASIERRSKVDIRPVSYSVAEDIAGEFDRVEDTLLVMATWGRGRSAGVVSNIGEDVLRLVRHPMIVLGSEVAIAPDWPNGPMLIATDGTHFGATIVGPAAELAKAMDVEPRVVTVIDATRVPAGTSTAAEVNSVRGLAAAAEATVGRPVQYDVLHGSDPGREIPDYAKRYGASSIAMSTHGRSGLSRMVSDSVAMDVVRHAHCPVMLNRPPSAED